MAQNSDAVMTAFMPVTIANIAIEVDADVVQIPDGELYEYGIMCRAQEASSAVEGYLLSVGATHARIGVFRTGGVYQELTPWRDILTETSGSRRLAAVCDGERIALYVDGELVAETSDVGLGGKTVGLFAVSYGTDPVGVHFDDLRLVHPTVLDGNNER